MSTMTDARIFTVQQVAERMQVSERTVFNWLRAGRLKGYRLGGRKAGWRIEEPDLDRFRAELRGESA